MSDCRPRSTDANAPFPVASRSSRPPPWPRPPCLPVPSPRTPPPAAKPPTACTSQWPGGFGASIDVTNLGESLTSWKLTWAFTGGQTITQLWNGNVTQSGGQVTVSNAAWNASLATNATATVGFGGTWTGSQPGARLVSRSTVSPAPAARHRPTAPTSSSHRPRRPDSTAARPRHPVAPPAGNVLDQAHTVGRVRSVGTAVQFTWPGTYFEGRFRGTGVGLVLNDSNNDYVVAVDGKTRRPS